MGSVSTEYTGTPTYGRDTSSTTSTAIRCAI